MTLSNNTDVGIMKKIKVVEISLSLTKRAGAEVFFESLCNELANNPNIELTVISLWDNIHESFNGLKHLDGVKFYSLHKKKGICLKAVKQLKKILNEINPDVINTHRSVLLTYYLAFGFRKKHWKIIHTIHNVPSKESNFVTNILRKQYIKKDIIGFVGISNRITELFKQQFPKANIETIFNGIQLKNSPTDEKKKYDFINVARFSEQKNHKLLFDAFEKIYFLHNSASLLCVGDGELFDFYKDYVSKLECKNNICFLGSSDEVYKYLAQSNIFILSSLYEGNPISILEAMNCGLPIIAPKVGGIPDVIEHNKNGLLYETGNKEELVLCMERCFTSSSLIEKMSINNKKDINMFSIEHCASLYINYFYRILNSNNKKD